MGFFPEEDYYLPYSQHVLAACSSLSKAEAPSELPLLLVLIQVMNETLAAMLKRLHRYSFSDISR